MPALYVILPCPVIQCAGTVNQGKTPIKIENGGIVLMAVTKTISKRVFQRCRFVGETVGIGDAKAFVAIEIGCVAFASLAETLIEQPEIGHRAEHPSRVANGRSTIQTISGKPCAARLVGEIVCDTRQDKANLAVEPPDGSLLGIEMGIQYAQGFHEMRRCLFGATVFVENETAGQIMAMGLHPKTAGSVALFVESQGGTYKGVREVMVFSTVKHCFHRVD